MSRSKRSANVSTYENAGALTLMSSRMASGCRPGSSSPSHVQGYSVPILQITGQMLSLLVYMHSSVC